VENRFEIGPRKFSLRKLDAIRQFHIVRRMGPMLSSLLPELQGLARGAKNFDGLPEDEKISELSRLAPPFMQGLAKLSDEDANYVLYGLLSCVEIQQGGGNWASVYANGMLMFQDLELPLLLQLAGRAFAYNLSGFFSALPQ
jgi:hypothetical protein